MMSENFVLKGLSVVLFCVMLVLPHVASAELSIAVVDVDRVLQEADAAEKLHKKRDKTRSEFLSELSKKEQNLREKGQELFEKRKDLSEEDFVKQRQDYEKKLLEVRKLTQERKRAFEKAATISLNQLQNKLSETVQEIAKEKGYALVLTTRSVVTGENALDITDETIKQMNAAKIDIPFKIKK